MIIIGEKINGTIKTVGEAIQNKDAKFIQDLAEKQTAAGADYLDVCAGPVRQNEKEILLWLVNIIQEVVETPLCIDSPNANVLADVVPRVKGRGIINSVSGEDDKPQLIFKLAKEYNWDVIALAMDEKGIPKDAAARLQIARSLIQKGKEYGIDVERIYIDPLVIALSTDNEAMLKFIEVMQQIKAEYPSIKIVSGLSNISFGMPKRKLVNRNFLAIALYAGMDAAILDPLDKELMGTVLAAQALAGKDKHCRNFANAFRQGLI